jgi:hypothetical protein
MTWQLFSADQPRYLLPDRWLEIEGQRRNDIRNPRCEGAVAGTPGTAPTNWAMFPTGGVVFNIVGSGTEAGIPYVDIRLSGTSTTGLGVLIRADQTYPTAAQNEVWTHSAFVRLVGGSLAGITNLTMFVTEWTAANVFVTQGSTSFTAITGGALSGGRISHTRTLTGATTGRAGTQIAWTPQISVAIDATFRIGAPQLELGAFASTPILPPAGAPAVSTRGADLVTAPLASLGIAAGGPATVLVHALMPVAFGTSGVEHTLVQMDDGTENNRFTLLNYSGTNVGVRRVLSAAASSASLGNMTPGTAFRAGFTISGGRMAGSLNGAAVVAVTGGPTAGLTTIRIGANVTGGLALFGSMGLLRLLPTALADGDLQAAVAAL